MSPYLVLLLILEFFPARLATLPYGLDSNVTKLLANLLKPCYLYFIILPIVSCELGSIKIIILLLLLLGNEAPLPS